MIFSIFLFYAYCCFCAAFEKALPGVAIELEGNQVVYATFSASSVEAPSSNAPLISRLYVPKLHPHGCSGDLSPPTTSNLGESWTVVLKRGGSCGFREKSLRAARFGASAVIIVNTVEGLYNETSGELLNACNLNCDISMTSSRDECERSCYRCSENLHLNSGTYCCVDDSLVSMYVGKTVMIPGLFVSLEDSETKLLPAAKSNEICRIFLRDSYEIDPSVLFVGILACTVLFTASYRAVSKERYLARWIWNSPNSLIRDRFSADLHLLDEDLEQVHLSLISAWTFVITSTFVILILFFLVQYYPHLVVQFLQVFFCFGSMSSFAKIFLEPIFLTILRNKNVVATQIISGMIALTWWLNRHSVWAWILLDLLAASLVFMFLISIRLPNLKVGTALLGTFFFYDIFMVFITPTIFSGKSVMVDVATAGRAILVEDASKCIRKQEEIVPMLFSVPRMDWYGGYSLIGLGDIVLPGLLLVLALRFDYARIRFKYRDYGSTPFPIPGFLEIHSYWIPLCLSYSFGLFITFVANFREWTFNGVHGQPALLYLVPSTLGMFFLLLLRRGEFYNIWNDDWSLWEKQDVSRSNHDSTFSQEETLLT